MTFAHYAFACGSSIHEHFHTEEEVYEVIEGQLEITIDGVVQIAKAGKPSEVFDCARVRKDHAVALAFEKLADRARLAALAPLLAFLADVAIKCGESAASPKAARSLFIAAFRLCSKST
jgi:hypothetical protein